MSTKTLKQRIAVVAATALSAGFLSIVSMPASHANVSATLATTNALTAATTLGSEVSNGLVTSSGTGTTGTAVLLSTGTLVVKGDGHSSVFTAVTVTGGRITGATAETTASDYTVNTAGTYIYSNTANKNLSVAVVPNSGVATMTVQVYENAAASTTSGTLRGQYVVSVVSASASGVYSAAKSGVNTVVNDNSDATNVDGIDEASSTQIASGGVGLINYELADAYDVALPSTGAIVISASGGGLVAFNGSVGTETAAASIVNVTAVTNDSNGTISVKQTDATKSLNTTVTISYNGQVVGTKSFVFEGHVAKVVVDSNLVSKVGSSTDQFRVKYYDDGGTRLYPADDTSNTSTVSGVTNRFITAASVGQTGNSATAAAAKGSITCAGTAATGALTGSAELQLVYITPTGASVLSNKWTHVCAGDAVTYKASFDKAVYVPGEIATLTVTGFDAQGKVTHAAADNIAAASNPITCTGCPNANTAITAPAATDVAGGRDTGHAAGTVQYKYVVTSTLGDFVAIVEAEEIAADALGLSEKQSVKYSVKASVGEVTNAEVLKSIVALIASINKQIQALQKLILRR
jgi:hypothetical protein